MGHMLEHTLIDAQVRWKRMRGSTCSGFPGTDHAGIATQVMVGTPESPPRVSRRSNSAARI